MTDLEKKVHELFSELHDLPQEEWSSILDKKGIEEGVKERVLELLSESLETENFLKDSAVDTFSGFTFPFGGQIEEFRILRLIGIGGMGHVYLAEDTVLKRKVALKVVGYSDTSKETGKRIAERFQKEARAVARLAHPSVVQIFRTGEKEGLAYIVMEYVEGQTLSDVLEAEGQNNDPLTDKRCKEIAKQISQVADAIHHGHQNGVIHRDVKPSNILIDKHGNARLADFGIAKIETEKTLQSTGTIVGSCAYMSPEQARILKNKVDHRTDIFSLGVVLYEALSKKRPFDGDTVQAMIVALMSGKPKPLLKVEKKVPEDLAIICHKSIEKQVDDRYQSAAYLSGDLQCFINGTSITARPPSVKRRVTEWLYEYRRTALAGLVVSLVILVCGLGYAYVLLQRSSLGHLIVPDEYEGARVKISKLDEENLIFDSPELSGEAPVSFYLESGLYRIIIETDGKKLEATSLLEAGLEDVIRVKVPKQELLDSLVEIPGGKYKLGEKRFDYPATKYRMRTIPAFKISATEVSNREYKEFLDDTGEAPPKRWPKVYDRSMDKFPATGMTWDQANRYCRWRGVRLPSFDEWEAAAKGPGKTDKPWGNKDIKPPRQECDLSDFGNYRKYARPVDSDPHLSTHLDVRHMLSNVQEFTEGYDYKRGVFVKGRSWVSPISDGSADLFSMKSRDLTSIDLGFRVAISLQKEE